MKATVHPSSILRTRDAESRAQEKQRLIADLAAITKVLAAAEWHAESTHRSGWEPEHSPHFVRQHAHLI